MSDAADADHEQPNNGLADNLAHDRSNRSLRSCLPVVAEGGSK